MRKQADDSLYQFIDETEAEIVEYIERLYGDDLTVVQAYFLGKLLQAFGPSRTHQALVNARMRNDPLRYAFASLMKGELGKGKQPAPTEEIKYYEYNDSVW